MDQRINNRDKDDPRFLSGKDKKKLKKKNKNQKI